MRKIGGNEMEGIWIHASVAGYGIFCYVVGVVMGVWYIRRRGG